MQKFPDPVTPRITGNAYFLFFITFLLIVPVNLSRAQIIRKSKVTFLAADSLLITADHYYSRKDNPYILLFHTEDASRGEFDSISSRFARMKYNCLVVDLRSGSSYGYVENETAGRARQNGYETNLLDGLKDVQAAIHYAVELSGQPVILLGSSSSASLCIIEGKDNPDVSAIMAFSPGEFFKPKYKMSRIASKISKPLFVAGSSSEAEWLKDMFANTDEKYLDIFLPSREVSKRGTALLTKENPERDQYWLAVLIFIKSL